DGGGPSFMGEEIDDEADEDEPAPVSHSLLTYVNQRRQLGCRRFSLGIQKRLAGVSYLGNGDKRALNSVLSHVVD
ncbi:hypothetical protein L6232_27330, partial [Shewanella sp. C31]|nr:hypothetical protein [Shewanella electrica]